MLISVQNVMLAVDFDTLVYSYFQKKILLHKTIIQINIAKKTTSKSQQRKVDNRPRYTT
jgi:hypothetical protein